MIPEDQVNIEILLVDVNLHMELSLRRMLPNLRIESISTHESAFVAFNPTVTICQSSPDNVVRLGVEEVFKISAGTKPTKLVWVVDGFLNRKVNKSLDRYSDIDLIMTAPVSVSHLASWLRQTFKNSPHADESFLMSLTAQIWEQRKPSVIAKVQSLQDEVALIIMKPGSLPEQISAERMAHQLAGSLGTFGKHNGSIAARRIEEILIVKPFKSDQSRKISSLLIELEDSVSGPELAEQNYNSLSLDSSTEVFETIDSEFSNLMEFARLHETTISVSTFLIREPNIETKNTLRRRLVQLVSPHISSVDLCYWHDESRLVVVKYFSEKREFHEKGQEICRVIGDLADKNARHVHPPITCGTATYPNDGRKLSELIAASTIKEFANNVASVPDPNQLYSNIDIVVIDDDELLTETLGVALKTRGHSVSIVSNGQKALELLDAIPPNLSIHPKVILLDLDLPGMSGADLLRKISDLPVAKNSEVIVVSGRSSEEATLDVLANGASEFVQKPFLLPVLIQRVELKLGLAA